jgi:hypothetical protein
VAGEFLERLLHGRYRCQFDDAPRADAQIPIAATLSHP